MGGAALTLALVFLSSLHTTIFFSASYPQPVFCSVFVPDQKPTVVRDGYLLCPAPVLYEVGQ